MCVWSVYFLARHHASDPFMLTTSPLKFGPKLSITFGSAILWKYIPCKLLHGGVSGHLLSFVDIDVATFADWPSMAYCRTIKSK